MARLILPLLLTLLSPCMAPARASNLPEPDPDKGTLAVSFLQKMAFGPAAAATDVYFARLGDDGDPLSADRVLLSNLSRNKQAYILNCEPGRYVAVAAHFVSSQPGGKAFSVFLDQRGILESEVVVEPGQVAYMGNVLVSLNLKLQEADEMQSHFLRLLEPETSRRGFTLRTLMGSVLYLATALELDQSTEAEIEFLTSATRKVFRKHPAWRHKTESRLAEVQGAPQ
jgi:hypothetical protein